MRVVYRLAAATLLALTLMPAHGAENWERFFVPFLGDLRAEAADARSAGKKGVMLMFHFEECPACAKMKRDILSRPDVQSFFSARFSALAIDTLGSLEITGFDGRKLPEKVFARVLGVQTTPTFMFFAPDGKRLAVYPGGIYNPADFILLGDYVASGAYRDQSFSVYKQMKRIKGS